MHFEQTAGNDSVLIDQVSPRAVGDRQEARGFK